LTTPFRWHRFGRVAGAPERRLVTSSIPPATTTVGSCSGRRQGSASADPLFFAVVERVTGRAVGMCSVMRVTPAMRTIELGHI